MKNIKNKEIEPYNNIYLGMHATVQAVLRCYPISVDFSRSGIWGKLGTGGSGYMSEELCQVSPKSHYVSLALHSDPSPYKSQTLLMGCGQLSMWPTYQFSPKIDAAV